MARRSGSKPEGLLTRASPLAILGACALAACWAPSPNVSPDQGSPYAEGQSPTLQRALPLPPDSPAAAAPGPSVLGPRPPAPGERREERVARASRRESAPRGNDGQAVRGQEGGWAAAGTGMETGGAPPVFKRPQHVRGLYLNAWVAGSRKRLPQLLELASRTEVNSFVIDLKDASGYVSHRTAVPLAREIGATEEVRIPRLHEVLKELHEAGIYPIARIVVFKDPLLASARPELSVQDSGGGVWVDGKGQMWLDPHCEQVWDYNIALAREAARLGFPEIQWDYVRFPDAPRSEMDRAVFVSSEIAAWPDVIRAFLERSREELASLNVVMTADVFGITTLARRDTGIGQVWERLIDVVDVALPMVYPSHYHPGNYGFEQPNGFPYEIVLSAMRDAAIRSAAVPGAGAVRPWLQDFTLGKPPYGPAEVRAQIQAVYDAGLSEWILWNPGSRYTEGALEPDTGFPEGAEPWIRVRGKVIPASDRIQPSPEA